MRFQVTLAQSLVVMLIAGLLFHYVAPYFKSKNRQVFPLGRDVIGQVDGEFKRLGVTTIVRPLESGAFFIEYVRFIPDESITGRFLQKKLIDIISVSLREKFGESVSGPVATTEIGRQGLSFYVRRQDSHWKVELITIEEEPHDTIACGEFYIMQNVERSGRRAPGK